MQNITNGNGKEHKYQPKLWKHNLTNQRFGRLIAIERSFYPTTKSRGYTAWLCRCDCGVEKIVLQSSLLRKLTSSCGCIHGIKFERPNGLTRLIYQYKSDAAKRRLDFQVPEELFVALTQADCSYCGAKPSKVMRSRSPNPRTPVYTYNGIDRIDSSQGYYPGNIATSCRTCNFAKSSLSKEQFLTWASQVYKHSIEPAHATMVANGLLNSLATV